MDKVLHKRFTAVRSEEKPVTGPTIIEKVKSFHDEMKTSDQCIFSEGWLQNLGPV
jgi:hypothetical protein